jgi:hypothetical protein
LLRVALLLISLLRHVVRLRVNLLRSVIRPLRILLLGLGVVLSLLATVGAVIVRIILRPNVRLLGMQALPRDQQSEDNQGNCRPAENQGKAGRRVRVTRDTIFSNTNNLRLRK